MKRKLVMATMALILCGTPALTSVILPVKAEAVETAADSEETDTSAVSEEATPDFSKLAGVWTGGETAAPESITITEDGLFVYHTADSSELQGYLEYIDEYGDGEGRYDMYTRTGNWLTGFYLDSDTSFHMGNSDSGTIFQKEETSESQEGENNSADDSAASQSAGDTQTTQETTYVLLTSKRYTGLKPLYNNSNWQGGYFYSDMTEDGLTVIVNCSASNDQTFTGTPEEYRKQFAAFVSETDVENYTESQSEEYTGKFTYPAYELSFTTGSNEDTSQWKMLYFQTDTHTFAYAYKMDADFAEEMESEYKDALNSLELTELLNVQNSDAGEEDDPSANGQSLEEFISYFDSWYQYGDLNAMSIHLYGEGTWEIYNSKYTDGSGGYLFDSGTFQTSGKTALQLYSTDGTHVADVSLNGEGLLFIRPMISGYGSIYADAGFEREADSIAYEAQTAGDGAGDYIPEENTDYEEGQGDLIVDDYDYSHESDPGDTYYWYDGEGNVMYFDGSDNYYMGPDDVFYIDGDGHLCEY